MPKVHMINVVSDKKILRMPRFMVLSNARCGSTMLCEMLRWHWKIEISDELLNEENVESYNDPLNYVEEKLLQIKNEYVGFKAFPEQIFKHGLRFDSLVRHINAKYVVVLWREAVVETIVSRRIAERTQIWYSSMDPVVVEKVSLNIDDMQNYIGIRTKEWQMIGSQWPVDVVPIFVKYEDLVADRMSTMEEILTKMSLDTEGGGKFVASGKRQNPAPLSEKISNWSEILHGLATIEIFVPEIVTEAINCSLKVSKEMFHIVPDREPASPPEGWKIRVSAPFTCDEIKKNVVTALYGNSVSSAGYWPEELSVRLKKFFGVPVAQPCCNGFVSIVLTLQAASIGKESEVIMPSLTMIAVANAVKFLQAIPIFVDSKPDNYNPGWEEIADAITEKTKAVILTHTYGVPTPDLETIVHECKKRNLVLIEDISECVGVSVKNAAGIDQLLGTFGDFACASMYANKIVHAGDGGFVLAKNHKLHSYLRSLVNHGFTPSYHFLHFESAINGKINGLGAAMACGCIDEIEKILTHRSEIANTYRMRLQNTPLKTSPKCGQLDTPWVFGVECESKQQRRNLRAFMAKHEIETRDFFFPLHLQPAFSYLKSNKSYPNAEHLATCGFYLPTHPNLSHTDLNFICDTIDVFFDPSISIQSKAALKTSKEMVLVFPGSLRLESVVFDRNGEIETCKSRGTDLLDAVQITIAADHCLINERWDDREIVLKGMEDCIKTAEKANVDIIKEHFQPYMAYMKSQRNFEPTVVRPWLSINLTLPVYQEVNKIITTTDVETLQMLSWLVKETRSKTILELGCLFGHATGVLAATALQISKDDVPVVYACDAFLWQKWMNIYAPNTELSENQSFQHLFDKNMEKYKHVVKAVVWPYKIHTLPEEIRSVQLDLVYMDFTQDAEELEFAWKLISSTLVPNKTIVVVNGLSWKSISFLTNHAEEMEPIMQPYKTLSKAFLFTEKNAQTYIKVNIPLARKLDFYSVPEWSHHHQNAFAVVMEKLKSDLGGKNSPILFIPSVEEYFCDNEDVPLTQQWIGLIHEVPNNMEGFYVPDLKQLCSNKFINSLKYCIGLFTLTNIQAKFLQQNWPKQLTKIPIQSLTYPFIPPAHQVESEVLELWINRKNVQLVLIGGYARDFDLFFNMEVPTNVQKVLLLGNNQSSIAAKKAPGNVKICDRLSDEKYERLLQTSIVFLSLLYDGAANTVVLECIARNVPIVCPSWSSCVEYLGCNYPLFYNPEDDATDFLKLITKEKLEKAIWYLKNMDKSKFSVDHFINTIKNSAVLMQVPPVEDDSWFNKLQPSNTFPKYDVTISICSYKRTHHLPKILTSLWEQQDFQGNMEIIVWNNNEARNAEVSEICKSFIHQSSSSKCLNLIHSAKNYFAQIRLAMPALMQSSCLLVCDDDIIPESNFVSFFMDGMDKYPNEVLCLRGHKFFPHSLNLTKPTDVWLEYDNLKFVGDYDRSQFVHFAHADACLIPKIVLHECASVEMPDPAFALVDDYWMSFILNHKFGRKVRKLSLATVHKIPLQRTNDSDDEGLAMHTRPHVQDARIRLYIYHMTQGWPIWEKEKSRKMQPDEETAVANYKIGFWDVPCFGINTAISLTDSDIEDLKKLGVKFVRIGAVGVGKVHNYEFSEFLQNPEIQCTMLLKFVSKLAVANIQVVITLDKRLATSTVWKYIAEKCGQFKSVVGYDLINEPFTDKENGTHLSMLKDIEDDGSSVVNEYKSLINAIREVDKITPIIIEPSYWGHIDALDKMNIKSASELDPLLIISIHFYEPAFLVRRTENHGRFQFPGEIPIFDTIHSERIRWDDEKIKSHLGKAVKWASDRNLKLFVGEFGICREVIGADKYLQAITRACKDFGISAALYSFRDQNWEAMNYELGPDVTNGRRWIPWEENKLMKPICNFINDFHNPNFVAK